MEIVRDGATLVLSGDFDVRSTLEVRSALHELLDQHDEVVVDMRRVETIDQTALKVLAAASWRAVSEGRHVTLRGCGPAVRRMAHLTRLHRVLEVEKVSATA